MAELLAPQSLSCPGCSAPFDYDGRSATVRCPYCKTVVAIPDHLRDDPGPASIPSLLELQEIMDLAQRGQKIDAIRLFRERYGVTLQQAKYSVETLEKGQPIEMPGQGMRTSPSTAAISPGARHRPPPRAAAPQRGGMGKTSCLLFLVILFTAFGIIAVVLASVGGTAWLAGWLGEQELPEISLPAQRLLAQDPVVLVPAGQGDAASFVSIVYDPSASVRKLAWVDLPGRVRWTSELGGESYLQALVTHGELVYAANGSTLQAVHATDGSRVWLTQMTDEIITTQQALVVLGGRVIALTSDRNLQAFDANTGRPAWSRRLNGTDRRIRLAGDRLLVLDWLKDDTENSLLLVNPADGAEELVIKPECYDSATRDESFYKYSLGADEGVIYDAKDDSLYLVYGAFFGCAQRYNLKTGSMEWETKHEGGFQSAFSKFNALLSADWLYFGYGENLASVKLATGELVMLLEEEDYQFVPLALVEERLVVRAMSSRGTRKFELWGLDPTSGRRAWQAAMGSGDPLEPPNEMAGIVSKNEFGFTWLVDETGFLLVKFMGSPNQIVLERLDLESGSAQTIATLPLQTTSADLYTIPDPIGMRDGAYWVLLDSKVLVIDIHTGELIHHWQ